MWPDPPIHSSKAGGGRKDPLLEPPENQPLGPLISEFRAPDRKRMNLSLTTWSVTHWAILGNCHCRKTASGPSYELVTKIREFSLPRL